MAARPELHANISTGLHGRERIAVIGAGHVGATAAYALMLRALVGEIVLIDANTELAQAEAADLADANAMARPARIWAGTYADAATATIAVITAGAATHADQSRLEVAGKSAAIVAECVGRLVEAGFAGIVLVAANPVDLMSLVALRRSGFPSARVIGTGTLLDSARLLQHLAADLTVAAGSIDGWVIGEHGDSEVAAFSTVRVGGLPLVEFTQGGVAPDQAATATAVREAGYRIVSGKGYTSWGIATAIVRICEIILRDERAIVPVSTLMTGQYGVADLYMSLPCILGAGGVERVLTPDLTALEVAGFRASANVLRDALKGIELAPA